MIMNPSYGVPSDLPHATATLRTEALPRLVPLAILCADAIAVAAGFGPGMLIVKFGMLGSLGLWGAGALGGLVSRKITGSACPLAAWNLVAACVIAYGVAEVSWYHWNFTIPDPATAEHRVPTWAESFTNTPGFLWQHAPIGMAFGAIAALFGAQSAYWQAGRRYRVVLVSDES
jgi:hypothetical protein